MSFHSSQTTPTGISSVSLRYLQRLETIQNTAMPETILAGQTVDTNAPELFPEFTFRSDTHQTNRFISSGIAYETTSRQSQHKSSITKDQQANDSDSIDEHHPGPLTRAIFTTPSRKRSHMAESIFDAHGTSSSFCTSSRPKVPSIDSIVTGALFNDDSVKSDFIFKAPKVPESLSSDREASPLKSRLIEENSSINFPQTLADDNFTTVNDNENMETLREVQQDMEENDMIEPVESAEDLLNSILNASVGLERCRNQQLEKTIMNEGKLNMSTLYCKRYAADAYRNVLKDYYTPIRFDDWNNIVEEMIENQLMEPNLDYIPITTEGEPYKTVMIGDPDQEIVCENRFDCGDILESVEEIEESFDGTRKLITSTPNENPNNTRKSISSSPLRAVSGSDKTDEVRGSYINFIERLARGDDGTNDSHPPLMLPNGHDQQTSNVQLLTEDQRNSPSEYDFLCFNLDEIATGYQMSPEMEAVLKSQDPVHALQVPSQANPIIIEARKKAFMDNIEKIVYGFLESLANQKPLALKIKTVKGWNDCKVSNGVLSQKETVLKMKTVSFVNKGSEKYFTVLVHLLCEIYKLLERNTTCTKRELYYRNVELLNNQEVVNKAIDQICIILNVLPWELGILSSSKGLIAGKLMIEMDNETIDCSTISSVPANPSQIQQLVSNAEYILIVEKDTVFQRLVNDPLFAKVLEKTVIMTAKGYPDINTRLLLKKISVDLQIPIYILVDADPHGVDIMCTYKYGSLHLVHLSEQLAVPKIEWIGIHPSDIDALDVTHVNLTPGDLKMVDEMLERPYVDAILRRELNNFKTRQLKAEIESIYHFSINYLIDDYIPRKIRAIATPIMQLSQENHLLDD